MIFTNTGLTKDNIIFDFDISNIKSYNNNTNFTVTGLTFWEYYTLSDMTLTGYGQTMYDFGLATSFTQTKQISIKDRKLVLNRIGYNDASGNTTFPQIILNTGITEGKSFTLSGGYLTTFFKLPEKNYQLGKYRNENGFTIDTWIYIDQNSFNRVTSYSEGFFLYFGTKSENKFNLIYSASTDAYTNSLSTLYNSGFTYDTNNYLEDISYNAFGFKLNDDKSLSLRYISNSGLTSEVKTDNTIQTTGWTNITTTFKYCKKLNDYDNDYKNNQLLDCVPLREGDLKIFVNGKLFHEEENMEEFFWLKKLNTDSDKQIGLPYTINWGGGSFGLKNSYTQSVTSFTATTSATYTNFIVDGTNGTFEVNNVGIDSDLFFKNVTTSLSIFYSGTTSLYLNNATFNQRLTGLTDNIVIFQTPVPIQPSKKYIFKGYFYDQNSWTGNTKGIYLDSYSGFNPEITVVSSLTYTSTSSANTWNELKLEFDTPSVLTGPTSYTLTVKIDPNTISGTSDLYNFYFDQFTFNELEFGPQSGVTTISYDLLLNKNLKSVIQENFDGSFYGGIQRLRMYDIDLDFNEVKKNYNYFSNTYNFIKLK